MPGTEEPHGCPECPHGVDRAELATSARFRLGVSGSGILDPEESKQIADGETPVGRLRHRKLSLYAVAVPAAALFLDDVPGDGEVADDSECTALGDADGHG